MSPFHEFVSFAQRYNNTGLMDTNDNSRGNKNGPRGAHSSSNRLNKNKGF